MKFMQYFRFEGAGLSPMLLQLPVRYQQLSLRVPLKAPTLNAAYLAGCIATTFNIDVIVYPLPDRPGDIDKKV